MDGKEFHYAETILSAAILYGDQKAGLIFSTPKPGRHHTILNRMQNNGIYQLQIMEQGFLTSTGRFVDRYEGMRIAKDSGAFLGKTAPEREDLFSEDLW